MSDRWFSFPKGMDKKAVAQVLYAYLDGANIHRSQNRGPFVRTGSQDNNWQLDTSNDFWLFFQTGGGDERVDADGNPTARIVARYTTEQNLQTLDLMAQLFQSRYPTKEAYRRMCQPA